MIRYQQRTVLMAILLVSFAAKITLWGYVTTTDSKRFWTPDSPSYHNTALAWLHSGTFARSPEDPVPQSHRSPGFPFLIATVYSMWGHRPEFVSFVLILLSMATICIVYRMAVKLFGGLTALLAVLLLALDLTSFAYSMMFLTETLFTLLITVTALTGVHFLESHGKIRWVELTGLLLALATFVRPISYYFIIILAVLLVIWLLFHRRSYRIVLVQMLGLLLPFILLVGGWQIRNFVYLKSLQFSSISGANMYYYRAAAVIALRDNISLSDARQKLANQFLDYQTSHPETKNWTEGQISGYLAHQGINIVMHHPILLIRTQVYGIIPMMLSGGEGKLLHLLDVPLGITRDSDIFNALSHFEFSILSRRFISGFALSFFLVTLFYLTLLYFGILAWSWRTFTDHQIRAVDIFLWGFVLYFIVISAGPEAYSRFRIPIMPILVIYAAQGLTDLFTRIREKFYAL